MKYRLDLCRPDTELSTGNVHKRQRKLLNPVFSTAHMKLLLPVFQRLGLQVSVYYLQAKVPMKYPR